MKRNQPKAFRYFKKFEDQLRGRSGFRKYFVPSDPFYSIYNVGPYTLSRWKVMWPEVGNDVRAGVCGPTGKDLQRPSVPDHTIVSIACGTGPEAYFIAALLNSSPARAAAAGYIVLHPSPHILEHIAIPRFKATDKRHSELARLSESCHVAASSNNSSEIARLEERIDREAAKVWGITAEELKAIQEELENANTVSATVTEDDD